MRILLIGATGTIGSAIKTQLEQNGHDVLAAGPRAEHPVDLGDPASIKALFADLGPIDAVISAAGRAPFGRLDDIDDTAWDLGLSNKLMGQVNLVRFGRDAVTGSFTLTSGMLAEQPNPGSTVLSLTNAGLEGFARAASIQTEQRVNVVSPPLVRETAQKLGWGPGGVPAETVAQAYVAAVEGSMSGQVLRPGR